MTRLLVSVRNALEAELALRGGADVVDVKEPSRGALGAAEPAVWRQVVTAVNGRAAVSVALGELRGFCGDSEVNESLRAVAWAKLGFAGMGSIAEWPARWLTAMESLPSELKSVAVIYADWQLANAPRPEAVLDAAAQAGLSTLLIDTYDKSAGTLLDHLSLSQLQRLSNQSHKLGFTLAIAGSLRLNSLPQLAPLEPDYIAVRGAACAGGREGEVNEHLVRQLSSAVRNLNAKPVTCSAANA